MEARGRNRDLDGHERITCRQELKREGKGRSPSRSESRWGGVEAGKGRPGIQDHTHTRQLEAMEKTLTQTRQTTGKLESQPRVQTERGKSLGPAEACSGAWPRCLHLPQCPAQTPACLCSRPVGTEAQP